MKQSITKILSSVALFSFVAIMFSSCYETHYYRTYNHHTRGWYERRHVPPPAGVNFEIDVRTR